MVNIVDSVASVGSSQHISRCRSITWHVPGKCWPYSRNRKWKLIRTHPGNVSACNVQHQTYWFVASFQSADHITFTTILHPAIYRGGVQYNSLRISFLHNPQYIYHILLNNYAHHLLKMVSQEDKVSYIITASTTMRCILHHCGIMSYNYTRASEYLIVHLNHVNIISTYTSILAACLDDGNRDMIGW
jgi:hypothetical protein